MAVLAKEKRLYRHKSKKGVHCTEANFVEVSGNNLEFSDLRFLYGSLKTIEKGVWFSIRFPPFSFTVYSN